ncbi:hypothetical protein D3C71_899870 [compost metagenome]
MDNLSEFFASQIFTAEVKSYSDYYPFGMQLPNRKGVEGDNYRYGFNGKERDDELKGNGNSYDFGARMYDPRIGRWFSRDPLFQYYPDMSEYNYAANNPIYFVDADGRILKIRMEILYIPRFRVLLKQNSGQENPG